MMKSGFRLSPPLLNSACPWATTLEDLQALYNSPYTGAVTTRTTLITGFKHDPTKHQHVFFQAGLSAPTSRATSLTGPPERKQSPTADITLAPGPPPKPTETSSLNTYGYSPIPLSVYLEYIKQIHTGSTVSTSGSKVSKPFIISVTGTSSEIVQCHELISSFLTSHPDLSCQLGLEINLSCPNIADKPPPAYDGESLRDYLRAIATTIANADTISTSTSIPSTQQRIWIGLKLPPYTYHGQFDMVVRALREITDPAINTSVVDFITCTNTLGSSLVLDSESSITPTLASESGTGIGGMAGAALHPLALGNVKIFRGLLDRFDETRGVVVIGVGGVEDGDGVRRMMDVGAGAVAVASALGRFGVDVFERMNKGLQKG